MSKRLPLVLVPGLLCTGALWSAQVAALSDIAEIHVTEDHAAHDSMGAIAAAILDKVPEQFALAGLSMGGYVAFEIMRRAPERVLRLALLDTQARDDGEEMKARRRGLMELAQKGNFKGVTPRLLPLLLHPERLDDAALVTRITEMAADIGQDGFLRQQRAILDRPDSRPDLAAIRCPTLVVCGAQDQLTPPELSEEMADGIEGAELFLVEHCGHLSTLEQPKAVNGAMRAWLEA